LAFFRAQAVDASNSCSGHFACDIAESSDFAESCSFDECSFDECSRDECSRDENSRDYFREAREQTKQLRTRG
jgi:hypothetical protein